MKIKLGTTRFVLLVGDSAIKIARIRPIRCFFRIVSFPFTSIGNHERFYKKYGNTFATAIPRYIFFGFYANRMEFDFYQKHPEDCRIVPTVKIFAWGLVVIQKRGSSVSSETLELLSPFKNETILKHHEVHHPKQFCQINNKVLLVDYGHRETCKFLVQTA